MLTLYFEVVNQYLKRIDESVLAAGSENYAKLSFLFNQDWFGIKDKTALFESNGKTYYQLLDNNNECFIPNELLADNPRNIILSIYGGNRLTTNKITITVDSSGFADHGVPSIDENSSIYDKIMYYLSNSMQNDSLVAGKNISIEKLLDGESFIFDPNYLNYLSSICLYNLNIGVVNEEFLELDNEWHVLEDAYISKLTDVFNHSGILADPSDIFNNTEIDEIINQDAKVKVVSSCYHFVEKSGELVLQLGSPNSLLLIFEDDQGNKIYNSKYSYDSTPSSFPEANPIIKYKISTIKDGGGGSYSPGEGIIIDENGVISVDSVTVGEISVYTKSEVDNLLSQFLEICTNYTDNKCNELLGRITQNEANIDSLDLQVKELREDIGDIASILDDINGEVI